MMLEHFHRMGTSPVESDVTGSVSSSANAVRPHSLVCFYMQKLFANDVGMYNRHFLSRW